MRVNKFGKDVQIGDIGNPWYDILKYRNKGRLLKTFKKLKNLMKIKNKSKKVNKLSISMWTRKI